MHPRDLRISRAVLESPHSGVIELTGDWTGRGRPRLFLAETSREFAELRMAPGVEFARSSGFHVSERDHIRFVFDPACAPDFDPSAMPVYLAGSFNGWQEAVGNALWQLEPKTVDGRTLLVWEGAASRFFAEPNHLFKFVTAKHRWFDVPHDAPNAVTDPAGNRNHAITPHITGRHRFVFGLAEPLDLSLEHVVVFKSGGVEHAADLQPGAFFFELGTDLPLGAIVGADLTTFRLFAPRARSVKVGYFRNPAPKQESIEWRELHRLADGVWEIQVPHDLHGWFYWYRVDGPGGLFSSFDPTQNIVDPYALALVGRAGPGIVLDAGRMAIGQSYFKPPAWQDLTIVEAHVRDLLAKSPIIIDPVERRTFGGLVKWVDHRNCHFKRLGVNAVELQPVQEFDNATDEEYHWGYMPVSYFAPESSYGRDAAAASQVVEFQQAVEAFHRNGFAVIVDVVYNHVGEPNHLHFIDKLYYFETTPDGLLTNWSGCGNDLRCRSAMTKRLIIDSLVHLVRFYGVDGFRFDLAELIGVDVLRDVEIALKAVHPGIILIAEPWSFRGHIAAALRDSGYASWNDGYREFVREYVRGRASLGSAEYFLRGSPWHFARWPAQTVNYTESHDDRTWLDVITENAGHNGHAPTANDIRRTHLMAAFLFASIGIPMLSAGQDFLRSKHGVNNTYLRGDLNALDYRRVYRFPGTHAYFASWIRFRAGRWGRLFRHFTRPEEGFLEFHGVGESSAFAVIYNANGSHGPMRLLFAINPHDYDVTVPLGLHADLPWHAVADHERFFETWEPDDELITADGVFVPSLGCGLWTAGG